MSRLFFFFGIICILLSLYLVWIRYTPQSLAFNSLPPSTYTSTSQKTPVRIDIARLNISLAIYPMTQTRGKWMATDKGVAYLSSTPLPGERGNSVLYGHNWPNLLGHLVAIRPGDDIIITFSDGTTKHFQVAFTTTVTPDETHVLSQGQDSRITLYTCTGFLDSKRFVAVASPL